MGNSAIFILSILTSIFLFSGCSSNMKGGDSMDISYEEFQKLLSPRSIVLLEGKNAFLTVIAMPGDKYPRVYRYDMTKKDFTLVYDHGQGVSYLAEDRAGKNIYLHIDNNGDENTKIYIFDPGTKKVSLLFGRDNFKARWINSDKTGKYGFFVSNFEKKSVYSVYRIDMASKKVERLTDGKTNLDDVAVSVDGSQLVAVRGLSNNESQAYHVNVAKKKMRRIFKFKNSIFSPSFFSQDGKYIFGQSTASRDRVGCARIKVNKPNSVEYIASEKDKDISCGFGEWSGLYWLAEQAKGKRKLRFFKTMFKDEVKIPSLLNNQSVSAVGYDRVSKKMLLQFSAANNPGSLYNFKPKDFSVEKVLDYNRSSIAMDQLATSYDYEYKSFDGMNIHGIIYMKPEWKTSGKKYPLVVWPHGGPDSYERHRYRDWFQFLALNGFIVFAPNYRGSAGYGKRFETLNDKDWGGAHIRDLVAGKEAIKNLPYIDEQNMFIFGGSFGGYSTLAAVTFQPKEFKAAVGFIAIGNLFTFMKSIPPDEAWQAEFTREIGDPKKDKALYRERSPFFHVNKIQTPLQIYQAENDVRTVKSEMDEFVAEMKKQGKPVQYTVLKDVGHGLATPESRKQVLEGTVKFFKSFIR